MIGYFFAGSKSNGLYITPYKSVTPSSALTLNGSGNLKPASTAAERSVDSRSASGVPAASTSTDLGALFTRDDVSTKYFPESLPLTACVASPGSSSLTEPVSSDTRYACV